MNVTELLQDVKRTCSVPDYQKRYEDSDLIAFAETELRSSVLEVLMDANEEYNVVTQDFDVAQGQAYIEIPSKAVGQAVRAAFYKQSTNDQYYELIREEIRNIHSFNSPGNPNFMAFQDDRLYLLPVPSIAGTLKMYFRRKHSSLVLPEATGTVLVVSGFDITLTDVPPATFVTNELIDIIKGKANFQTKAEDLVIVSVLGNTITFTTDVSTLGIVPGDIVALAGQTSIIQLPSEAQEMLVSAIVIDILKGLNIMDQVKLMQEEFEEKKASFLNIVKPRSQDSMPTLIQRNGLLSRGGRRFPSVSI